MIELYLFEQLLVFAECGTLSAASEKLHISQPALSQSMKKLERQLNVPIFEHHKNKLTLNETGKLTVRHARKLLAQQEKMIEEIRLYDKTTHTICFGSCAPVPIGNIKPLLSRLFDGMTISAQLKDTDSELWDGLHKNIYQFIIVHEEPGDVPDIFCYPYRREHLCLLVPAAHPLSRYKSLRLKDLENQNLLLCTPIGFWYKLYQEKIPSAHFLYMDEIDAFTKLAESQAFPCFTTSSSPKYMKLDDRYVIPIEDDEVNVTYYFVCKKAEQTRFNSLINRLKQQFSDNNPN